MDIADNGGDDVASCNGGTFAVFVFAFFGDDATRGDETLRHNSHSICRYGSKWVARRSLFCGEGSLLLNQSRIDI